MSPAVARIGGGDVRLRRLLIESQTEGFDHVRRLIEHWADGSNRFERQGEALFGVMGAGICVAVGGLNCDPYTDDPGVGRVRHVYVSPAWRRLGVGSLLLQRIITRAQTSFCVLRLRAARGDASLFYDALGFARVADDPAASHQMTFRGRDSLRR